MSEKAPATIYYELPKEMGGLFSADFQAASGTYAVMSVDNGYISREDLSVKAALAVQALVERGEYRKASYQLNPIF